MTADESLVTLNGLKKYDQKKGKAVIEANELPASPLNKVYNVGDDVYSKDVRLSTYQQMIDEVSKVKVKVDGKTNEVVINQSLTSTQYNNLTTIDPKVNYFITDKKQIYRNGYCYSIKVTSLSQADYNNLTPYQKQDTMALYIVDNNKLYYLEHPVGMLGNELRYTSSIPTEDGFFVYTGNVPNAAGLYRGCIYFARKASDRWVYDLFTPKYSEDIIEKSAFTHIQSAANATQHAVNEAIDHEFYVDELAIEDNATSIKNLRNQLNNLGTTDVTEHTPLSNIGSPAFDSQHAINIAIDGKFQTDEAAIAQNAQGISDIKSRMVKSVNSQTPDSNGNVSVDVGVKSVNSQTPDSNGNVSVDVGVKSVNSQTPDSNGNVVLSIPQSISASLSGNVLTLTF